MSKTIKENNNTGSVCILVQHFILLDMEYSMGFLEEQNIGHLTQVKAILIRKIISGPPPSLFLLLYICIWQHLQELSSCDSVLLKFSMPA